MKNNNVSMKMIWLLAISLWLPLTAQAETYTYDAAGRLTGVTYADSSSITYTYDANGNILNKTVGATATVALALNAAAFNTAAAMILNATTVAGNPPTVADVYVALQLPDGTLLVMQPGGSFAATMTPLLANVSVPAFTGPIFNYTFTGAEPVGNYTWFAALTQPGTFNVIGTLAAVPFTFAP